MNLSPVLTARVHLMVIASGEPLSFLPPFLNFIFYCTGETLWRLRKFSQYVIVEFSPPLFSFILLEPLDLAPENLSVLLSSLKGKAGPCWSPCLPPRSTCPPSLLP